MRGTLVLWRKRSDSLDVQEDGLYLDLTCGAEDTALRY